MNNLIQSVLHHHPLMCDEIVIILLRGVNLVHEIDSLQSLARHQLHSLPVYYPSRLLEQISLFFVNDDLESLLGIFC